MRGHAPPSIAGSPAAWMTRQACVRAGDVARAARTGSAILISTAHVPRRTSAGTLSPIPASSRLWNAFRL